MLARSRIFLCAVPAAASSVVGTVTAAAPAIHPFIKILGGATYLRRNKVDSMLPIEEALPTVTKFASASSSSLISDDTAVPATPNRYVMLYFSAHWCPPCRQFTPILSKFYNEHKTKKQLEVVFCSWDQNEAEFSAYFKSHPEWLAVDRSLVDSIATTYNIQTIPSLLVFDAETGELVTRKGRLGVAHDPAAKEFPWQNNTYTSHVNVNAPKNAVIIGGVATFGASVLLWMFAQTDSVKNNVSNL